MIVYQLNKDKLTSSTSIVFIGTLKITLAAFLADFKFSSCKLDNTKYRDYCTELFYFHKIYCFYEIYSEDNFTIPCEKTYISFFFFFKSEKHCCFSCSIKIFGKISLWHFFWISIKCLLFT